MNHAPNVNQRRLDCDCISDSMGYDVRQMLAPLMKVARLLPETALLGAVWQPAKHKGDAMTQAYAVVHRGQYDNPIRQVVFGVDDMEEQTRGGRSKAFREALQALLEDHAAGSLLMPGDSICFEVSARLLKQG